MTPIPGMRIANLEELLGADVDPDDWLVVVDKSDAGMPNGPTGLLGTDKKLKVSEFLTAVGALAPGAGPVFNALDPRFAGGAPGPSGDNYPAIQAAIDASIAAVIAGQPGGPVLVPYQPTYPISRPLKYFGTNPDADNLVSIRLVGGGGGFAASPRVTPMAGFGELPLIDCSAPLAGGRAEQPGVTIENLYFDQTSNPLGQGIYIDQVQDISPIRVKVDGGYRCWTVARANTVNWRDCESFDCSYAGLDFLDIYPDWVSDETKRGQPVAATPQFYDLNGNWVYTSANATTDMQYGLHSREGLAFFYHGGPGNIRAPGGPFFMQYGLYLKYAVGTNVGSFFEQLQLDAIWDGHGVPGGGAALYLDNCRSIWFPTIWAGGYSAPDGGGGMSIVLKDVRDIHFPGGHINGSGVQLYGLVDGVTFGQIGATQSVYNAVGPQPLFVIGATAAIGAGVDLTAPTITFPAPTAGKFDPDGGSVSIPTAGGPAIVAYTGVQSGAWGKTHASNGSGPVTAASAIVVDITGSNPWPSSGSWLGSPGQFLMRTSSGLACFNYASVSVVDNVATFTLTTSGQGQGNFTAGSWVALVAGPITLTGCSLTSGTGPSIAGLVALQGCSIGPNGIDHRALPVYNSTTFPKRSVNDGVTTSGSPLWSSQTANLTPNDIGKVVFATTNIPAGTQIASIIHSTAAGTQAAGGPTLTLNSGAGFQASGTLAAQDATGVWQYLTYSSFTGAVFTISAGWAVDIPNGALVYQASAATLTANATGTGSAMTCSIVGDYSPGGVYSATEAAFVSKPMLPQSPGRFRSSYVGPPGAHGVSIVRGDGKEWVWHFLLSTTGTSAFSDPTGVDQLFLSVGGVGIGNANSLIKAFLTATVTWDPPPIATGTFATTTITIVGAAQGDTVVVGFTTTQPAGVVLLGAVTAPDTVTVTMLNLSGSTVDLASGTLRADVWQH